METFFEHIQTGNVAADSKGSKGWFVGAFLPKAAGLRQTKHVAMRWTTIAAGKTRKGWIVTDVPGTMLILVSGKLKVLLRDGEVVLDKPGDYVIWGRGTEYRWHAQSDATIITASWPAV